MSSVFYHCDRLTNLNLSSLDTSNVEAMNWTFAYCGSLVSLNLKNASFSMVTSYSDLFTSIPATIQVTVKDSETQTWIQDRLGSGIGTVIIA